MRNLDIEAHSLPFLILQLLACVGGCILEHSWRSMDSSLLFASLLRPWFPGIAIRKFYLLKHLARLTKPHSLREARKCGQLSICRRKVKSLRV